MVYVDNDPIVLRHAQALLRGSPQGATGLDLVEPGLVQVHQWRPDPGDAVPVDAISAHGAVGRKLCDHAPGDRKAAPITGHAN